jgi:hypothetical protein
MAKKQVREIDGDESFDSAIMAAKYEGVVYWRARLVGSGGTLTRDDVLNYIEYLVKFGISDEMTFDNFTRAEEEATKYIAQEVECRVILNGSIFTVAPEEACWLAQIGILYLYHDKLEMSVDAAESFAANVGKYNEYVIRTPESDDAAKILRDIEHDELELEDPLEDDDD